MYVCIAGPGNYMTHKGRKKDRAHMDLGFAFTGVELGDLGFKSSLFTGEFKNIRREEKEQEPHWSISDINGDL